MANNMAAPPRPLNNRELVWESTYLQLCDLYASGKRNEALDLAWECYQDPVIPRILRTTCCIILGTADGDYLMFAQEGVEFAKSMVVCQCQSLHHVVSNTKLPQNAHPDNPRLQAILKEAQEVLDLAEQDSEADHKEAVADAGSADADADAEAAGTEQLEINSDLLGS